MLRTDVNCMLGHWPFRKIRKNTFEDLKKIHEDNNISFGFISSLDSIFYNDPFEGDEELHEIIKNSGYYHVLTINPMLPEFCTDIAKGLDFFKIKGVKIYPGYHNYRLNDTRVDLLCDVLRKNNLPLFIVLRLEDERLNHLVKPVAIEQKELARFIHRNSDNKIVILNANMYEIIELSKNLDNNYKVFFDISGLKGPLFPIEKLLEAIDVNKILFGSLHPLYCFRSTLLNVENAQIEEEWKEKIMGQNIELILK